MKIGGLFNRFTDRAKHVFAIAECVAKEHGDTVINVPHLLVALLREGSGVASTACRNVNLTHDVLLSTCEQFCNADKRWVPIEEDNLPGSFSLKRVVEYSIEEARNLNHNYVGTEHLLLAIIRAKGNGYKMIVQNHISPDNVRREVFKLLGHDETKPTEEEKVVAGQVDIKEKESCGIACCSLCAEEVTCPVAKITMGLARRGLGTMFEKREVLNMIGEIDTIIGRNCKKYKIYGISKGE